MDKQKREPYVKKEDIARWYPVSREVDSLVQRIRHENARKGIHLGDYQAIELAVSEYVNEHCTHGAFNEYGQI